MQDVQPLFPPGSRDALLLEWALAAGFPLGALERWTLHVGADRTVHTSSSCTRLTSELSRADVPLERVLRGPVKEDLGVGRTRNCSRCEGRMSPEQGTALSRADSVRAWAGDVERRTTQCVRALRRLEGAGPEEPLTLAEWEALCTLEALTRRWVQEDEAFNAWRDARLGAASFVAEVLGAEARRRRPEAVLEWIGAAGAALDGPGHHLATPRRTRADTPAVRLLSGGAPEELALCRDVLEWLWSGGPDGLDLLVVPEGAAPAVVAVTGRVDLGTLDEDGEVLEVAQTLHAEAGRESAFWSVVESVRAGVAAGGGRLEVPDDTPPPPPRWEDLLE